MPQALTNLLAHIIFSTKDRTPFLVESEILTETNDYLGGVVNHNGGKALAVGGMPDHVHLLVVMPKNMTVPDLVRELKRASSRWIKKKGPSLHDFAWQGGYGAFSVGQGEVDVVRSYIMSQAEHHRKRSFQEEYRAFLDKYGINYDSNYLWD